MICDVCKRDPNEGTIQEHLTVTEAEEDSPNQAIRTVSEFDIMTARDILVDICRECFIMRLEKKRA